MEQLILDKIQNKKAKIAVVGLGYVGLPLAVAFAKQGYHVIGIDIDQNKIAQLKEGYSYIIDVPRHTVSNLVGKSLEVTYTFERLNEVDIILICVPTPLNKAKEPDVTFIVNAMDEVSKYIKRGTLVILESTTYPGTTHDLIVKKIKDTKGYEIGADFFVCYSPERVDPGNKSFNVENTPKVVGGETPACSRMGYALYSTFLPNVVSVSGTKVAEMSKLLENTFRSINIAMMNEMTIMAERMGINIWEVIEAAASKPFGFMPFYPGPGIGGHCIPLDPLYLSWEGKKYNYFNRFIELAADVNANMPHYVVTQIQDILNNRGKCLHESLVLLLGVAYKKDIDDLRESPALEVYDLLIEKGASVKYHDPFVQSFKHEECLIYSEDLSDELIKSADLIVILTDHTNLDYQHVINLSKGVYDTRNVTKNCEGKKGKVILLGEKA